ncbi:DUF2304 domain-containing protein [Methanobrevibacter filiformis]|uniref:DUF2304 domain-containing protein n=1 Tax=Methanobrevibacter filiformis TaxID=55758 RepID=A0A166DM04_9EURY|nr:DUF2304 family protein [Methanobrevibacter filiformis]KZX15740.1 hypothetical protein MBFIL_06040 [Methanobrevibacter filiformis]
MLYQILVIIVAIIAIAIAFRSFKNTRVSLTTFILWVILWLVLIVFTVLPESSAILANIFGIQRGLDVLIIFALIGAYYLIFRLFIKLEKIQQNLTELVRFIAIENEKEDSLNDDD